GQSSRPRHRQHTLHLNALLGRGQALAETPQAPPPKAILTVLLNDLGALSTPLALVLDDYHVITTPVLHETVTFLLDNLPPMLQLVMIGRADPPLPLPRWRVRNQRAEVQDKSRGGGE